MGACLQCVNRLRAVKRENGGEGFCMLYSYVKYWYIKKGGKEGCKCTD